MTSKIFTVDDTPVRLSVPVLVRESVPAPWSVLLSVRGVVSLNWSVPLTKGLPEPEATVAPLSSRSVAPAESVPPCQVVPDWPVP